MDRIFRIKKNTKTILSILSILFESAVGIRGSSDAVAVDALFRGQIRLSFAGAGRD
jgi:hypothetical protein